MCLAHIKSSDVRRWHADDLGSADARVEPSAISAGCGSYGMQASIRIRCHVFALFGVNPL